MKELILAASEKEVYPYLEEFKSIGSIYGAEIYRGPGFNRVVAVSKPGPTSASLSVSTCIQKLDVDRVVSVGIAGALPGSDLGIGDVVVGEWTEFADMGRKHPGGFEKLDEMDMEGVDTDPVRYELAELDLSCEYSKGGVATVSTVSASDIWAEMVVRRTGADVETMETAAVAQAGYRFDVSVSALTVVSNYCGDERQFDLGTAVNNLTEVLNSRKGEL
ncbi:MAG: hypothetical protein ABEK59_11265 [Halobacteria archaeon]